MGASDGGDKPVLNYGCGAPAPPLPCSFPVPGRITRIFSDLHYGDRASLVTNLAMLDPLAEGVDAIVLNGDSLDTRLGANPAVTLAERAEVVAYFESIGKPVTFLTGNHDPDLSVAHSLDLAGGRVFLTHGDILFDDIVPWGRDRPEIVEMLKAEFARLPSGVEPTMEDRLGVYRRVAAAVPQRHQAEKNALRYAVRYAADTIWPPSRILTILRAWRETPHRGASFGKKYRPAARFVLYGHTHRPGIWPSPDGPTVINTGSFTRPFGPQAVDLDDDSLTVRKIVFTGGAFRIGSTVARFSLA
jgi:predicted phosphodiesterase